MIIAICVQHPQTYQQITSGLQAPANFRFYDFHPFTFIPPIQGLKNLSVCLTKRQADLVILDHRVPFFLKGQALCKQFKIECLVYENDIPAILREVDMFASFYIEGEPDSPEPLDQSSKKSRPQEVVVKIGEKVVEKEVEKLRYTSIPQKLIAIGSLWPGAGSTLYAVNLARAIAERHVEVSYVEYPKSKPYVFDYLNIGQLEQDLGTPYIDYAKQSLIKSHLKVRGFRFRGVQWFVNDSRYPPIHEWTGENMLKFTYKLRDTPIVIIDVSNHWADPELQRFLVHTDHIYLCVEPDPVKIDRTSLLEKTAECNQLTSEYRTLQFLQSIMTKENKYQYIEMKMNSKVKVRTWRECLEHPPISSLKYIPYEDVLASVWESSFLYDQPRYQKIFETSFRPIIANLLPKSHTRLKGRNRKGLFKKRKRSEVQ